jgi:hypothetical protein
MKCTPPQALHFLKCPLMFFTFFPIIVSSCKALGAGFTGIKPHLDPPHGTLISIKPDPQGFYPKLNCMDWLEHVLCVLWCRHIDVV